MSTEMPPSGKDTAASTRLQILATEHWSLLATRSLTYTESLARVNIFLTILSGAVIALALVAQVDHFGATFIAVAIPVLLVVMFAGVSTISRLSPLNRDAPLGHRPGRRRRIRSPDGLAGALGPTVGSRPSAEPRASISVATKRPIPKLASPHPTLARRAGESPELLFQPVGHQRPVLVSNVVADVIPVRIHHEGGMRRLAGDALGLRRWEEAVARAVDDQQGLRDLIEYAFEIERVGPGPCLGVIL